MTYPFIDTNILVRFLVQDDQTLAEKARAILEQVESGKLLATTCEAVLVEAVYVLTSPRLYKLPRHQVAAYLTQFLKSRGLRLSGKRVFLKAFELYNTSSIDITDALLVAHMEQSNSTTLYSFDHDFDSIETVARAESPM
jgi:predicted nucleic acid-binding protein